MCGLCLHIIYTRRLMLITRLSMIITTFTVSRPQQCHILSPTTVLYNLLYVGPLKAPPTRKCCIAVNFITVRILHSLSIYMLCQGTHVRFKSQQSHFNDFSHIFSWKENKLQLSICRLRMYSFIRKKKCFFISWHQSCI